MRTVIVAPHPDDEWIGCGCLMLKKLDEGENVKVLQITLVSRNDRAKVSQQLSREYNYELKILGEPERNIDEKKLTAFLKKEIKENDEVYIPDYDTHPDHRVIHKTCKYIVKGNIVEYCVYNNSKNPYTRLRNKILSLVTGRGFPSFRERKENRKFAYKLNTKNENIRRFREMPRDADVFRKIKSFKKD